MQPTMTAKTEPFGLPRQGERFRQAAGLVELDIDGVHTCR